MPENAAASGGTPATLQDMLEGYRLTQLIYVAAELGLADLLQDGPRHYADLAQACRAHGPALYRLLCALAGLGVFKQLDGDRFELQALGQGLRGDVPGSLRARAIFAGHQMYPAWGHLLHSIRTGEPAFDSLYGMSAWAYRAQDPHAAQVFDAAMTGRSRSMAAAVVAAYDFARFRCIVDVGGGQGALLAAILAAQPALRGILFDLPALVEAAQGELAAASLAGRCQVVEGSFFDAVPAGGDLYILARILHDWDHEPALQILRECRRAMQPGQILLVVERIIDANAPSAEAAMADISMLVMHGGRERSGPQYAALLDAAGFALLRTTPTHSPFAILEAQAAPQPS